MMNPRVDIAGTTQLKQHKAHILNHRRKQMEHTRKGKSSETLSLLPVIHFFQQDYTS